MKVLLVLPAVEQYRIVSQNDEVPDRKMLRFSILPLTQVAALTPEGHDVDICDENVQAIDLDSDADVIGISFMTALAPRAYEIAREFRKRGKMVIAGGYHPTLFPHEVAEHFDAVVVGDAELLWPRALKDIEAGKLERLYRHDEPCSLAGVPVPRRDLLEKTSQYYATSYAVQTGRGCAHRCRYCSVTAFHHGTYRARPVGEVIEELRSIPKDFIFVDDNIIGDPEYARELFTAMIPLKKRWVSQCSLRIADDPELLKLARKSGCLGLFIGIETVSARNLESVDKGINRERKLAERVRAIHRAGIGIIAGIIVGMDYDETTVFQDTLSYLGKLHIDAVQVNILTPLPGTPLYSEMRLKGRVIDDDYSKYDFRHVVIDPARMSPQELQDGADWLYNRFYRLNRIAGRTLHALATMGPVQAVLSWRLNMTYRYDNKREKIVGKNPATKLKSHRGTVRDGLVSGLVPERIRI